MNYPTKFNPREMLAMAASITGALMLALYPSKSQGLVVTGTTSDNGYPAHLVQWTDATGYPRSAMMVDQNSVTPGPYTGYLRQYAYCYMSGGFLKVRICTGSQDKAAGGNLEFSGDGFVQNHGVNYSGADHDISTGNGVGFKGTTTISSTTGIIHFVTITYSIPTYTVQDVNNNKANVPTTVQWSFADGRNDPIFSVTQDATGTAGDLGLDSRSPYGDMAYDGVRATASPPGTIVGTKVGGYSYGDQFQFVTLASTPEEVTPASPWQSTVTNMIPYTMQWTDPALVDAEMGHVATVPLLIAGGTSAFGDQGSDSETSPYYNNGSEYDQSLYFDPRNLSYPTGPLPPWNTQAYQIINESGGLSSDVGLATSSQTALEALLTQYEPDDDAANPPVNPVPTTTKRLTWQTNFGRLGGFDDYFGYSDSAFNYSAHSTALGAYPALESYLGTRVNGAMMSYSTFVVLGLHNGGAANVVGSSYQTGAVGQVVAQMENVTQATLSATIGTVVTSGTAGIPSAGPVTAANATTGNPGNQNYTVAYSPAGYDPVYAAWNLDASANAVAATLTPATDMPLVNPLFCINDYTSTQLPAGIAVGAGSTGASYYASVDAVNHRLWIAANRTVSSAMNLVVRAKNDFNGDGHPDILMENTSTGQNQLWFMNGTSFLSTKSIPKVTSTDWQIVGTADFNGDGNVDILLENSSTGNVQVWFFNGTTFLSAKAMVKASTDLQIVGTGDFNGDGNADIILESKATGQVLVWFMSGPTFISTVALPKLSANWHVVGNADFNGDGNTDLLLQNSVTGQVMVWLFNGTTYLSAKSLPKVSSTQWQIVGTGDFNGDGKPDILLENTTTGRVQVWLMNGTTFLSAQPMPMVSSTAWQIRNR